MTALWLANLVTADRSCTSAGGETTGSILRYLLSDESGVGTAAPVTAPANDEEEA